MQRYVVLRHECPPSYGRPSHWDFMLEAGGALRTWALLIAPDFSRPQPADPLPDHRLEYLQYEGPVSGDRGTVTRWDEGTYEAVIRSDLGGDETFQLRGGRLHGRVVISGEGPATTFRYEPEA